MSFIASIGAAFRAVFSPETPGPVRNEIQRLFGETFAGILRNPELKLAVNRRAAEIERRSRLKDEELGYEAIAAREAAHEKMLKAVERTQKTQAMREARATDLRLREERDADDADTPADQCARFDAIRAARAKRTDEQSRILLDQLLKLAEDGVVVAIDTTSGEVVIKAERPRASNE